MIRSRTRPATDWRGVGDEELLRAYVAGRDRETAFGELVDRYERRVYAICYRYLGNHADAQDATQDTFLAVARRASTFRHRSQLSTWLYRVTVNACNDLARKRRRRPQVPVADVAEVTHPAQGADADPMAARETELEVQRALLALDDLSRTVLVLVALEGLSYQEVAGMVDLPVGTVKSRVHRARARMADLLTDVVTADGPPSAGKPAVPPAAPSIGTASPNATPRGPPEARPGDSR